MDITHAQLIVILIIILIAFGVPTILVLGACMSNRWLHQREEAKKDENILP